jgi:hypothetical protein
MHELGYAPTVRELMARDGHNSTSVWKWRIDMLVERGYLFRGEKAQKRTLRVTDKGLKALGRKPEHVLVVGCSGILSETMSLISERLGSYDLRGATLEVHIKAAGVMRETTHHE